MRFSISETAKWGDVSASGPKIIDASVKKRMKAALKDIQSGKFAKGWIDEYKAATRTTTPCSKPGEKHPIEKVGARLRSPDALDLQKEPQGRAGRLLTRVTLDPVRASTRESRSIH